MPPVQYTPLWAAPEVLQWRPFAPASDVYALTCTLYECLTHRAPFWDVQARPGSFGRVWHITSDVVQRGLRPTLPDGTPPRVRALFEKGWHPDPRQRCTAADMLEELIAMSETGGRGGAGGGSAAAAAAAAAASLEPATGSPPFSLRQFHEDVSRASTLMFPGNRLVKSRRWRGKTYENCVVGTEVVSFVVSRPELFFFGSRRARRGSGGRGSGAGEGTGGP
jgi:serine/threonine protein kinase